MDRRVAWTESAWHELESAADYIAQVANGLQHAHEMGLVHRRELSGVRHGLFRVQAFTQDDAHHFCTVDQIEREVIMLIDFFKEVYSAFDLTDVRIELVESVIDLDQIVVVTSRSKSVMEDHFDRAIESGDGCRPASSGHHQRGAASRHVGFQRRLPVSALAARLKIE